MAISAAQKKVLDNMCGGAQGAALGTAVANLETQAIKRGSYTAIAADDTANAKTIVTGLTVIAGFMVQVYRSDIITASVKVTASAGNLVVADNAATFVLSVGDLIQWSAW